MIRFENVGLRYGNGPEILRDINFHVLPGSFHFLTGPSGAGKTSLLRLLFMSLRPSRGLIYIFGENALELQPAGRAELRRRIGIVFQDFRLLDHLTTWENVALPLAGHGQEARPITARTSPTCCAGWDLATASTLTRRFCPAARSKGRRSPAP